MKSQQPFPYLGPFEIQKRLSQGGMGEVWKATHHLGTPVAIKVLHHRFCSKPDFVERFRREAKAMACLHHKGIVQIYDFGRVPHWLAVPGSLPACEDHQLRPGSPYMVMEYLQEGTLQSLHGKCEWKQARKLLFLLLEALSHAHARGVLHRDLKPGNVLLREQGTEAVLTDFGLVFPWQSEDEEGGEDTLLGTPSSMSPEQVLKAWRDYGPWTDLYGLGCLVYHLLGGHPVYNAETLEEWMEAHCYQPPQVMRNKVAIPQGVFGWVTRLLSKNPYDRFSTASEALLALRKAENSVLRGPWKEVSTQELDFLEDEDSHQTNELPRFPSSEHSPIDFQRTLEGSPERQTWPESWPGQSSYHTPPMLGVGVGLVGLRSLPLVARAREREELWSSLKHVFKDTEPSMVVLKGPAGCGKSHLVRWLCEEGQEAGLGKCLKALHDPLHGPQHGLRPMMRQLCQSRGLTPQETYERLRLLFPNICSEPALRSLAVWMQSVHDESSFSKEVTGFSSANERYLTLERVLLSLTHHGPLLLCFEDMQWGSDAIGFVDFLLRRRNRASFPFLLLLTYRKNEMRRANRVRLEALVERSEAKVLTIGPLSTPEQDELLRELLELEPELQKKVLLLTEGNPLFAIQLIRDWVDRKLLVVGDKGYRLNSALEEWLPDDIHMMWLSRLHRAVHSFSEEAMAALEVAAALGQDVDGEEWERACVEAGYSPPLEVLLSLAEQQLIHSEHDRLETGWSFVHGMLRESLERQAREQGRWADHHRCCALMLKQRSEHETQEREGRHWMEAGEKRLSFPLLLTVAERYYRRGDFPQTEDILELCFQALEEEPEKFLRMRCRANIVLGNLRFVQGERQEGFELGQKASRIARREGWKLHLAHALHLEGRSLSSSNQGPLSQLEEAEALFEELENEEELGLVRITLGYNARFRGDFALSVEYAEKSLANFAAVGNQYYPAEAHKMMGATFLEQRDLESAQWHFAKAMSLYQQNAHRLGVATCTNALGEIARKQARWREAETMYLRSVELQETIGSGHIVYPQVNLGQVWLQLGRFEQAEVLFLEVLEETSRQRLSRLSAVVYGALLVCNARQGEWSSWSRWFRALREVLKSTGFVESDVAELLEIAGEAALEREQLLRARQAYKLSLQQLEGLGLTAPKERILCKLEEVAVRLGVTP